MMECKFLWVQITPTDSGPPRAPPYENRRRYLGNGKWLLEKEHLVIFFNPLQLEIQSAVIKLQFLWLPTFAPEAVSEVFALHIQSPIPHHLLPLGSLISVTALCPVPLGC